MSSTFSAAVLVETGKPLIIVKDVVVPDLKRGQVLVRLRYAGLCHSQLMEARGYRGVDNYVPHMLGHEGVGSVIEVGPGVSKFKKNDDVVVGWVVGDGAEGGPKSYNSKSLGKINAGSVTTFSDYSVISENRLYKKPVNTPDRLAVLYGCALPTGVGLVLNELKPRMSSSIVVLGLGGIGLSALMAVKSCKPKTLIAVDVENDKLKLAQQLGASHTINPMEENLLSRVADIVGPGGVDYCVESAGTAQTIEIGFQVIKRKGGELIFASHPKSGSMISIDPFELISGKTIRGSWGGAARPDYDIPKMAAMYESGELALERLISHEYSLDEINEAMNDLENRKIVRAAIRLNQ